MPARRHTFTCGHLGFGAQCHRCGDADKLDEILTEMTRTKRDVSVKHTNGRHRVFEVAEMDALAERVVALRKVTGGASG